MSVVVEPVSSPEAFKRFVRLPMRINAKDPAWISPLLMEREEALQPKTNPVFDHLQYQFWIATKDGRDVGRISAQVDTLAPTDPNDPAGYFGMLSAEDDPEVFAALFKVAEDWLKTHGRTRAIGPFSLNINEETGLLVEGFETPPVLMMPHDPRYAAARVEAQGYAKVKDVYAYMVDVTEFPPKVRARLQRPLPEGVVLRSMDMKRYDEEVAALTGIVNDAWSHNWGFTPLTEAETKQLAKSLKPVLNPKLVQFAEIDGEVAGFGVCLPNVNEAIRDLDGKLLPFGWLKLLWRLKVKGLKSARVPLMGVKRAFHRDFRGQLLPFIIINGMAQEAMKVGIKKVELSWILEDNRPMRAICEAVQSQRYKTYRLYEKRLA